MVGQASSLSVGAHGCAPFVEDGQSRVLRGTSCQDMTGNPAFCAGRRHQILLLFAITSENPCNCTREGFGQIDFFKSPTPNILSSAGVRRHSLILI